MSYNIRFEHIYITILPYIHVILQKQLLGLKTEAEKNTGATIKSAEAASSSSRTAKIALWISIGAFIVAIIALILNAR